ncbi:MAG: AraC family transcriptional regulator [Pseudomonadota bacterium]
MSQAALDSIVESWGMDPARSFVGRTLGTNISAALWRSPDGGERLLSGTDADVFIVAYHQDGLPRAHMLLDTDPIYDGAVGANSWLVVPPGRKPLAEVRGDWNVLHLYIPTEFLRRIASDLPNASMRAMAERCARLIHDREVAPLLQRITAETTAGGAPSPVLLEGLCAQLAATLVHEFGGSNTAARALRECLAPWQRRRAEELIAREAVSGLTAGELAAALDLSRSHFSRAFRRETGMTVRDAILERRLDEAWRRVTQSDDPITQIAHECGFASASHLAARFRQRFGKSPVEARRMAGP